MAHKLCIKKENFCLILVLKSLLFLVWKINERDKRDKKVEQL